MSPWSFLLSCLGGCCAALLVLLIRIYQQIGLRDDGLVDLRAMIGFLQANLLMQDRLEPKQWWDILKVSRHASIVEIEAAYRHGIRAAHPDTGGTGDSLVLERLQRARAAGRQHARSRQR